MGEVREPIEYEKSYKKLQTYVAGGSQRVVPWWSCQSCAGCLKLDAASGALCCRALSGDEITAWKGRDGRFLGQHDLPFFPPYAAVTLVTWGKSDLTLFVL